MTEINLEYSFLMFLVNSFCLTGMVEKRFWRVTVVPIGLATLTLDVISPGTLD